LTVSCSCSSCTQQGELALQVQHCCPVYDAAECLLVTFGVGVGCQ
jgi:hypothetical protein